VPGLALAASPGGCLPPDPRGYFWTESASRAPAIAGSPAWQVSGRADGSTPPTQGGRGAISCYGHRRPRLFRLIMLADSAYLLVNAHGRAHFLFKNILRGW